MSKAGNSDRRMRELFLQELDMHASILSDGLLAFEKNKEDVSQVDLMMRAAHSIKGAARVLGFSSLELLSHRLEDCFLKAQKKELIFDANAFDLFFQVSDRFSSLSKSELESLDTEVDACKIDCDRLTEALKALLEGKPSSVSEKNVAVDKKPQELPTHKPFMLESAIRISPEHLGRIMGLAAEVLVEAGRLDPFLDMLVRAKNDQEHLMSSLNALDQLIPDDLQAQPARDFLRTIRLQESDHLERIRSIREDVYSYSGRNRLLSDRLYREVLAGKMRPLGDILHGFPRLIRDLSRTLDKSVDLIIKGEETAVDRDSLGQLEAPLMHLVRNACDHGIESCEARVRSQKTESGRITLEAGHRGGMLIISVSDDGAGIDPDRLRARILKAGLLSEDNVKKLPLKELYEFLFLPGFSTTTQVSEISGRGVGLDVVKESVQSLGGMIEVDSELGKGTQFTLRMPVTRSVVRALMTRVDGELYAFPLNQIANVLISTKEDYAASLDAIEPGAHSVHGHDVFNFKRVGSVDQASREAIILKGDSGVIAFEVDVILGEATLLVHPLDSRLGKVAGMSAASVNEKGEVVLIVDVPDLVHTIHKIEHTKQDGSASKLKNTEVLKHSDDTVPFRILIADDSTTVREAERRLLTEAGYEVEVAIDGIDAWEALMSEHFDLLITDIDMPRMTGFGLIEKVKQDPKLKNIPVMVVSYKDRDEDYKKAIKLGAAAYVLKSELESGSWLSQVSALLKV